MQPLPGANPTVIHVCVDGHLKHPLRRRDRRREVVVSLPSSEVERAGSAATRRCSPIHTSRSSPVVQQPFSDLKNDTTINGFLELNLLQDRTRAVAENCHEGTHTNIIN